MGHSKHNTLARTFINFYKIKLLTKLKGVSFKKKKSQGRQRNWPCLNNFPVPKEQEREGLCGPLGLVSALLVIQNPCGPAAYFTPHGRRRRERRPAELRSTEEELHSAREHQSEMLWTQAQDWELATLQSPSNSSQDAASQICPESGVGCAYSQRLFPFNNKPILRRAV